MNKKNIILLSVIIFFLAALLYFLSDSTIIIIKDNTIKDIKNNWSKTYKIKEELGSFGDFDPNKSAVKDIKVALVQERGINRSPQGGAVFYAADRNNITVVVNADKIPPGIESAEIVILRGHLNQNNSFHAHDVVLD